MNAKTHLVCHIQTSQIPIVVYEVVFDCQKILDFVLWPSSVVRECVPDPLYDVHPPIEVLTGITSSSTQTKEIETTTTDVRHKK